MTFNEALKRLITDTDDDYAEDLRSFFLTVVSVVPVKFIGIDKGVDIHIEEPVILTNQSLEQIYDSYRGKLTDSDYLTRVLMAGTYHLPTFDLNQLSDEWIWVAKLLHLLIYFAQQDLPQRIRETTTESRKWMNPTNYNHSIWRYCYEKLQGDTLASTYRNFESYRKSLEQRKDPSLKSFLKIYRTIDFAFNDRNKITRNVTNKRKRTLNKIDEPKTVYEHLDNIDDDTDELVSVMKFDDTDSTHDINRERLDNPVPDFTYIKQSTVTNVEKYSANQIYRRTQAKFSHANKNERFICSNIRQLPVSAIQNICNKLWQWFEDYDINEDRNREQKRAIAYLLLSLYTGYSVARLAEDINENNKSIIRIGVRKNDFDFIIHLDITPLRIRTAGIKSVTANRLTEFTLPIPQPLGIFLTYKGYPDSNTVNEIITRLRKELALPLISLGRIEKSLYTLITHKIATTQIASIITARNNKKRADLWYCSHSIQDINQAYQQAINMLTKRCGSRETAYNYLKNVTLSNEFIGSQNSPDYPIVSLFIEHLRRKVITTTDYIDKFNVYNLWLWHISLLLTSIRAVEGAPGFLNQFNLDVGLAWISDKEERASSQSQRLVPVCSFLKTAINNFINYLKKFSRQFGRINPKLMIEIKKMFNNERPLLNYLDKKGDFTSLRPSVVAKTLQDNFRFKVDWTRHVGQRYLHENKVDEATILAIFGHEMMGQEAWRKQSSLSIGDILSTREVYDKLAVNLKLQQVVL